MKKKFYRSCVAVLLSMVMIFGGVHIGAAADGGIVPFGLVPPTLPVSFSVSAPQSVMAKGDTQQLTYSRDPIGGTLTWSSSNNSVATVDSAGKVTAVATGNVTITGRYVYDGTAKTSSVSIQVVNPVLGIKNATEYYIMNYNNDYLLSLISQSDDEYTAAYLEFRMPLSISQWTVELQSDGKFQFINGFSTTNKCLSVNGYNLCINTDTNASTQKFTIERATEEPYEGLYLIKCGNEYVADNANYNVVLTSVLSDRCYWSFMPVEKRRAELFAFNHTYVEGTVTKIFNTTGNSSNFEIITDDLGYYGEAYENRSSAFAYQNLYKFDDIFVFTGHGEAGVVAFTTTNNQLQGIISGHEYMGYNHHDEAYNINKLPANALSLARCVMYMGCKTANSTDTGYNLLTETFNKGAHFVLGATENTTVGQDQSFIDAFFVEMFDGGSIEDCLMAAQDAVPDHPTDYVGDIHQYLN